MRSAVCAMVGAGVDWIRFRRVIPDSVHGFGRYRAWWSGVRCSCCRLIVGIPRVCGDAVAGGRVRSGTGADWIGFRFPFSDSVHGFGRLRARWSGVRFPCCRLIVGILRFCGPARARTGSVFGRCSPIRCGPLARLPSHPRARRVNTNDCEVTPAKRYCNR